MKVSNYFLSWFLLASLLSTHFAEAGKPSCPSGCNSLTTCNDLEDLVRYLMCKSTDKDTNTYDPPTPALLDDWEYVVGVMLEGNCSSAVLPASLQAMNYELEPFVEATGTYCVLASFELDPSGSYLAYPYGAVIVNNNEDKRPLSIDIPHSNFDHQTYRQGIAIFRGTGARSFTLSLAHRQTTDASSCQGSKYYVADSAHNQLHTFQANAVAIKQYYESLSQDFTAIQFHGMGTTSCLNDDIYLSHGFNGAPAPGGKLLLLRDAIRSQLTDPNEQQRVNVVGDTDCTKTGTKNTQGRLYNLVPENDVCDTKAVTYTGRFIHAEQKKFIRTDPNFDQKWIQAINDANL